ncbi:putative regulatory protein [Pseudonocardia sp. Ae168_Ps1]|nr:putative regulatory protein [Pseudonocardia sp. Ae150A_Ps1]OLL77657.1 putative regulatory protein [Pseudonocardia sp. Ae168_Ps1]OLL91750.1 putative regulatory protein [Pseudonocardia sp. Ae356_Ps1]
MDPSGTGCGVLYDRDPELRSLRDAVAGAADGRGAALVVGGGVGTGRTALLDAAAGAATGTGLTVLRAAAALVERDFEHGVARQLFDPMLAAGRGTRSRWLAAGGGELPAALAAEPVDPPAPEVRHGRVRELQELLETVSAERPVLVLVDDLQWADTASLRWLNRLAARVPELPVALVGTVLHGDPGAGRALVRGLAGSATPLRTRPLGAAAVRGVVADRLGRDGEPEFVQACRDVSTGTPSVLHAVLDDVAATGCGPLAVHAGRVREALPAALRERFARCLRAQDDPARRYLGALAVFGTDADPATVQRLADLDPHGLRTVQGQLAEQGLLSEDHTGFAHPLVREVATGPAERERLHLRAAWLLHETGHHVREVAVHLLAVAAPLDDWAVEVLRAAAHQATTAHRPDSADDHDGDPAAVRYLRRALLDSDVTGHERGVLLVELAAAERFTEPGTAVRHVSQALPLLASARDRATALTLIDPSTVRDATDPVRDAVRAADRDDRDVGGTGPADDDGRAVTVRIRARARRLDEQRPEGLARSCALLREVIDAPDELLSTSAGRELVGVLLHAAALSGRVPAADVAHLGERLLRITPAREVRPPHGVPPGDGPRGLLVLALVAADRPRSLGTWLVPDPASPAAATADELALVLLAHGRPAEAAALPGGVLRERVPPASAAFHAALIAAAIEARVPALGPEPAGRPPGGGLVAHATHQLVRAAGALLGEQRDLALECFLDCGRHLEHLGWSNPALFPWRSWAARLLRRRGETTAALDWADEELALARAWGAPAALGRALRVRGSLVGGSAGEAQLREAVAVLGDSADTAGLGRAEIALGRHLAAAGDPAGEDLLRRGRRRVDEAGTGDAGAAGSAQAVAPAVEMPVRTDGAAGPTGSDGSDGAATAGPADVLTDAERQVVDRVVGGATNQMIAEELGVSRRAVEKRLTSAYRKLGVSGRTALPGAG